jgi:hypothetical protein
MRCLAEAAELRAHTGFEENITALADIFGAVRPRDAHGVLH